MLATAHSRSWFQLHNTLIGSIYAILINGINGTGTVVFETHDTHLLFYVGGSMEASGKCICGRPPYVTQGIRV